MITDFVTLTEIEDDIVTTCERIHKDVSTADDDILLSMMEDLSQLAYYLHHFASETKEWCVYSSCQDYYDSLDLIYQNLNSRLMTQ